MGRGIAYSFFTCLPRGIWSLFLRGEMRALFTPLNDFVFLFNWGGINFLFLFHQGLCFYLTGVICLPCLPNGIFFVVIPSGWNACPAWPACPVAPADGTGVGGNHRTGVNPV